MLKPPPIDIAWENSKPSEYTATLQWMAGRWTLKIHKVDGTKIWMLNIKPNSVTTTEPIFSQPCSTLARAKAAAETALPALDAWILAGAKSEPGRSMVKSKHLNVDRMKRCDQVLLDSRVLMDPGWSMTDAWVWERSVSAGGHTLTTRLWFTEDRYHGSVTMDDGLINSEQGKFHDVFTRVDKFVENAIKAAKAEVPELAWPSMSHPGWSLTTGPTGADPVFKRLIVREIIGRRWNFSCLVVPCHEYKGNAWKWSIKASDSYCEALMSGRQMGSAPAIEACEAAAYGFVEQDPSVEGCAAWGQRIKWNRIHTSARPEFSASQAWDKWWVHARVSQGDKDEHGWAWDFNVNNGSIIRKSPARLGSGLEAAKECELALAGTIAYEDGVASRLASRRSDDDPLMVAGYGPSVLTNSASRIVATDEVAHGAYHDYMVQSPGATTYLHFHKGAMEQPSASGVFDEDLLAIVWHRMVGFEQTFPDDQHTRDARILIEKAIQSLHKRHATRARRGVLGKNETD